MRFIKKNVKKYIYEVWTVSNAPDAIKNATIDIYKKNDSDHAFTELLDKIKFCNDKEFRVLG